MKQWVARFLIGCLIGLALFWLFKTVVEVIVEGMT